MATITRKMQLPNHAAATFATSWSPWFHFWLASAAAASGFSLSVRPPRARNIPPPRARLQQRARASARARAVSSPPPRARARALPLQRPAAAPVVMLQSGKNDKHHENDRVSIFIANASACVVDVRIINDNIVIIALL